MSSDFRPLFQDDGSLSDESSLSMYVNIVKNCANNTDVLNFFEKIQNTETTLFQKFLYEGGFKALFERFKEVITPTTRIRFFQLFLKLPLTDDIVCQDGFLEHMDQCLCDRDHVIAKYAQDILFQFHSAFKRMKPAAPAGVARMKMTRTSRQDRLCEAVVEKTPIPAKSPIVPRVFPPQKKKSPEIETILVEDDLDVIIEDDFVPTHSVPDGGDAIVEIVDITPKRKFKELYDESQTAQLPLISVENSPSNSPPSSPQLSLLSSPIRKKKKKNLSVSFDKKDPQIRYFDLIEGERINVFKQPEYFLTQDFGQPEQVKENIFTEETNIVEDPGETLLPWKLMILDLEDVIHFQHLNGKQSEERMENEKYFDYMYGVFSEKPNTKKTDSPQEPLPLPSRPCLITLSADLNDEKAFKRYTLKT